MKKIFLTILLGLFLISFISSYSMYTYDDFSETFDNTTKWQGFPIGTGTLSNTNGFLTGYANGVTTGVTGSTNVTQRIYLNKSNIDNITIQFKLDLTDAGSCGGGGSLTIFGRNITSANTIPSLQNDVWRLSKNSTNSSTWDVYRNDTYTRTIVTTNEDNKIMFYVNAFGTGADGGCSNYFYSDYVYIDGVRVYLSNPNNNNSIQNNTVSYQGNFNLYSTNFSFTNTTFYTWFSNGTLFNETTQTISGNNTNVVKVVNIINGLDYIGNLKACYANYTYSYCYTNDTNISFSTTSSINSMTYDSSAYETDYSNYLLNISVSAGYTPSNAKLVYNGTEYTATVTNTGGNNYTISKLLSLDSTKVGLNTFYFKYNISSNSQKLSSNYTQTVNNIQFGLCNSSLTRPYFNISFKDESTEEVINATVPTSTFYYWLGDSTNNKTYTYSNTTLNYNYTFCFIPQNKTIYLKPTFQYNNPDYVQRTYEPSILTLTNATTNVTLYLLSTTDGLYVTFQLTNLAGQTISGVDVSGTRLIGSTTTTVASGTTGSDGGITFWLNYHYSHTFTFSKSGYETVIYTLTPTQSSYTVTMGSTTTSTSSYTRGIHELIYPNFDFLDNLTEYDFNYTIDSDYWSLDSFGFNLYYQNGTLIGSDSSTSSTGGTVSVNNINFSTNQTYIYMNYFYEVNNTYINGSRTWIIQSTDGRSFSIWQFFTDFKSYIDSGNFWGFDEFGKILLSVIVLIMVAGSASLRYGVRSDIFVIGIIFGVILILDYGLGWFGTIRIGDNIAVSNLPTIVLAMAMLITIIMEERK